jgi:hypothetical protein
MDQQYLLQTIAYPQVLAVYPADSLALMLVEEKLNQ